MISREKTATNVMTFGDLKIQAVISKPAATGEETGWVDATAETIDARYGMAERRVQFTNTGSQPMYVRARLGVDAKDGSVQTEWTDVEYGLQLLSSMPAQGEGETEGWVAGPGSDGETGWYYYSQILQPGETTEPLISSVELEGDFNTYVNDGYVFNLDVLGQGVQSEHQVAPDGGTLSALTAQGWPSDEDAGDGTTTTTTNSAEITEEVGA